MSNTNAALIGIAAGSAGTYLLMIGTRAQLRYMLRRIREGRDSLRQFGVHLDEWLAQHQAEMADIRAETAAAPIDAEPSWWARLWEWLTTSDDRDDTPGGEQPAELAAPVEHRAVPLAVEAPALELVMTITVNGVPFQLLAYGSCVRDLTPAPRRAHAVPNPAAAVQALVTPTAPYPQVVVDALAEAELVGAAR